MKFIKLTLIALGLLNFSYAEDSIGDQIKASAKDAKRSVKKGWNRTKEAACGTLTGDNKIQCFAKKAQHRVDETADHVVDKLSPAKEAIDSVDKK